MKIPLNEKERVYEFPPEFAGLDSTVVTILEPRALALMHSELPLDKQLHIVEDHAGAIHYVPAGWKHITVIPNEATALTNIIAENVIESGAGGDSKGNDN